jgi:hypothetical protein
MFEKNYHAPAALQRPSSQKIHLGLTPNSSIVLALKGMTMLLVPNPVNPSLEKKMRTKIFCSLLLLFHPLVVDAQVREDVTSKVKSSEKSFQVKYATGGTDRFVYVFSGFLTSYMKQDGKTSSFKHPTDSRRCYYQVGRYIEREGFYLTGDGRRVPLNEVKKVVGPVTKTNKREDILKNLMGKHSPCNDHMTHFAQLKQSASAALTSDFDALMLTDIYTAAVVDAEGVMNAAKLEEIKN